MTARMYVAGNEAFLKAGRSLMEQGEITQEQYAEMLRRATEQEE